MNDYFDTMQRLNKLVDFSTINSLQRTAELFCVPAIDTIKIQQELYDKVFQYEQATRSASKLLEATRYNFNIREMQKQFATMNTFLTSIELSATISRAFNQLGIPDAIANISRNMPTIEAIAKLNSILPTIKPIDHDISCSDNGDVIVDDVIVSRDEIFEMAEEFNTSSLATLSTSKNDGKIRNKKWSFFALILWYVLYSLFLEPIVGDVKDEIRERLGINRIIEQFNISSWFDEIFGNLVNEEDVNEN